MDLTEKYLPVNRSLVLRKMISNPLTDKDPCPIRIAFHPFADACQGRLKKSVYVFAQMYFFTQMKKE